LASFQRGSKTQPPASEATMPSLTIKNIRQDVLDRLKEKAKENHRSLNQQVIDILTLEAMSEPEMTEAQLMARMDRMREKLRARGVPGLTWEEMEDRINEGHK
jgi:plasmid stability protein